jgi:hypothetical protein
MAEIGCMLEGKDEDPASGRDTQEAPSVVIMGNNEECTDCVDVCKRFRSPATM